MSFPPLFVVSCSSCRLTCFLRYEEASSAWRLPCGRPPLAARRSQQCPVHHSGQRLTLWTCSPTLSPTTSAAASARVLTGDVGVFYNVLVSFLRGSRTSTLYRFGNIVGGVPIGSVSEDLSIVKSKGQQRRLARLRRAVGMTEQLGRGSRHT
jgi:hypothetical protein